jgi:hypothetical protein
LYTSPLFQGGRRFAEQRFDRWFILSAKYGLVEPSTVIQPYEKTLKKMAKPERLRWAQKVFKELDAKLRHGDLVGFLAGLDYREFLGQMLEQRGFHCEVPLEGLSIGMQLSWLKKIDDERERLVHLDRFYSLLAELEKGLGGRRRMRECTGAMCWPQMGVYFFFEDGEHRSSCVGMDRVVRVGTHTVSAGSKTTLWHRLRTHRGGADLSGNHRGSIFRLHVGTALLAKSRRESSVPTWAQGQSASREIRESEGALEKEVSTFIGDMSLLWLAIGDEAGATSDRSYIERNSIALLSGSTGPIDLPTPRWLGRHSAREPIRRSGLWNVNYVEDSYDARFLQTFADYVDITLKRRPPPDRSIAPTNWFKDANKKVERKQLLLFTPNDSI